MLLNPVSAVNCQDSFAKLFKEKCNWLETQRGLFCGRERQKQRLHPYLWN